MLEDKDIQDMKKEIQIRQKLMEKVYPDFKLDDKKRQLEKNRYCDICGELLNLSDGSYGYMTTDVAYPPGENDNCKTKRYSCKNGHWQILSIVNKNPETGWRGREECFCCRKVEEWPEEVSVCRPGLDKSSEKELRLWCSNFDDFKRELQEITDKYINSLPFDEFEDKVQELKLKYIKKSQE